MRRVYYTDHMKKDPSKADTTFHTFVADVTHGGEIPKSLECIPNNYGAIPKFWNSWGERARRMFNLTFETMVEHQVFLQATPIPTNQWVSYSRQTAYAAAQELVRVFLRA